MSQFSEDSTIFCPSIRRRKAGCGASFGGGHLSIHGRESARASRPPDPRSGSTRLLESSCALPSFVGTFRLATFCSQDNTAASKVIYLSRLACEPRSSTTCTRRKHDSFLRTFPLVISTNSHHAPHRAPVEQRLDSSCQWSPHPFKPPACFAAKPLQQTRSRASRPLSSSPQHHQTVIHVTIHDKMCYHLQFDRLP